MRNKYVQLRDYYKLLTKLINVEYTWGRVQ